ncbi:hypothetical protein JWH04_11400 [Xanthomonas melonis]|nr:hypothetical protein [Xanthomonas melonis]MCD0279535.1 hypothetical protein [Xanthomonas melonis]
MHWPETHWQPLISWNPHTLIIPLDWHCAITPAGSVGLLTLTQAGNAPQQLPTFLTVQSASTLQVVTTVTGLAGVAGEGVAAVGAAATQPISANEHARSRLLRDQDKVRDMRLLRSRE